MRRLVQKEGLADRIVIDSAGTGDWHVGEPPDRRSVAVAKRRGVEVTGRARRFAPGDWDHFDYVLAMDAQNFRDLERTAPASVSATKLHLFRTFDPESPEGASVPDPYYTEDGFDEVLDLCERACRGLLARLRADHQLG